MIKYIFLLLLVFPISSFSKDEFPSKKEKKLKQVRKNIKNLKVLEKCLESSSSQDDLHACLRKHFPKNKEARKNLRDNKRKTNRAIRDVKKGRQN